MRPGEKWEGETGKPLTGPHSPGPHSCRQQGRLYHTGSPVSGLVSALTCHVTLGKSLFLL